MGIWNLFSLEGKNAVVIGGSRGLGKGMSIALAQAGATVAVVSRNREICTNTALEIKQLTKREAYGIHADIATVEGINTLFIQAVDILKHIDILINCAGVNIRKPSVLYSETDWDTVQNVQLKGTFFCCRAAAEHMIEKGIHGHMINISSINAKVIARPDIVSYVAAKAGVMQMTKALSVEWACHGITVNAIAPGFFRTDLTQVLFEDTEVRGKILSHVPVGRFGDQQKDLAGIAVYFASDASSYTTGQMVCIDGGYTAI